MFVKSWSFGKEGSFANNDLGMTIESDFEI
jgi:hypothetical protein